MLLVMLAGIRAEAALYLDGLEANVSVGNLGGSNLYLYPKQAIDKAIRDRHIAKLQRLCEVMSKERQSLFDRPFLAGNPTRDRSLLFLERKIGGKKALTVAFYTLPEEDRDCYLRQLEARVADALGGDASLYEWTYREPWFEPALAGPESPMVAPLLAAGREVAHRELTVTTISKQDSFMLTNHAGISTVSFGVARMTGPGAIHEPDEFIEIERAWLGSQIAYNAVLRWLDS